MRPNPHLPPTPSPPLPLFCLHSSSDHTVQLCVCVCGAQGPLSTLQAIATILQSKIHGPTPSEIQWKTPRNEAISPIWSPKLRKINLLFSSMFCIERKIVHVGAERKSSCYFNKKFTLHFENLSFAFNDAEDQAIGEFDEKYVKGIQRLLVSARFFQAWHVKHKIMFVQFFLCPLRNISVTIWWSIYTYGLLHLWYVKLGPFYGQCSQIIPI